MRFSTAITAAFVAGAVAKPHGRRDKSCAAVSPAPSSSLSASGNEQQPPVVLVPVPAPVATSTGSHMVPSLAPQPTGSNNTAAFTSSFVLTPSSAVSEIITSSALSAEPSTPASEIPVGEVIFSCTEPGTFALTYDDGPFTWTNHILDLLAETDIKATFFVNGNNFGNINDFQDVLKRMIADGHQIGSHTYDHGDLATLGDGAVITEMTELEDVLDTIIGKIPTYMRPPYFSYNDRTLAVLKELGYHVIQADIDTFDYQFRDLGNLTGGTNLEAGIARGGNLALAHDVHQNTAEVLTPAFIKIIQESGLRGVTVGECLGDSADNWYRTRRTSTPTATGGPSSTISITSTVTPTGVVDPNGACGGTDAFVCNPGACCSQYGYCGTSEAYCDVGCQPLFGVCGVNVPVDQPGGGAQSSEAPAPAPTGGVSPDGSCGGTQGYTCITGACCSQYGFCGSSQDHCGTGCQSAFGICN